MSGELPVPMWPQSEDYVCKSTVTPCHPCGHAYEKALRLAWEARARLAVAALNAIQSDPLEYKTSHAETTAKALAAIGELP